MFESSCDTSASTLAEALRSLPSPTSSPDFDDRVLAALRVPTPWWQHLWQPAKPLLLSISGSCVLTLLLLHTALHGPAAAPPLPPAALSALAAARRVPSIDTLLDQPNLCAGSLTAAWNSLPTLSAGGAEAAAMRPQPRRRADARCGVTLTA